MKDNRISFCTISHVKESQRYFEEYSVLEFPRKSKKSKITAVPTAFSLGGTIFGGSMTNSASTRKCCLQSCNFRFFPPWRNLFKSRRMNFEYMTLMSHQIRFALSVSILHSGALEGYHIYYIYYNLYKVQVTSISFVSRWTA